MKKFIKKKSKKTGRFFRNNRGQGMVEYILLLVVVIGLVMIFKNKIIEIVRGKTDQVGAGMDAFQVEQ